MSDNILRINEKYIKKQTTFTNILSLAIFAGLGFAQYSIIPEEENPIYFMVFIIFAGILFSHFTTKRAAKKMRDNSKVVILPDKIIVDFGIKEKSLLIENPDDKIKIEENSGIWTLTHTGNNKQIKLYTLAFPQLKEKALQLTDYCI